MHRCFPHTPFNPPSDLLEIYKDLDISESAKVYYAMCTWFDRSLGEFLKFLRKENELDNTLLIYINDNGWQQDPDEDYTNSLEYSTIGGPKGKKSLYDFGYRTPIIFNKKNDIKGGLRSDELVSSIDVFTTILDYANSNIPKYLTGKSLVNLIKKEKKTPIREKIITYLKILGFLEILGPKEKPDIHIEARIGIHFGFHSLIKLISTT